MGIAQPEKPADEWGQPISEERQRELIRYQTAWNTSPDHKKYNGPFHDVPLSGADVFFLAGQADLAGPRIEMTEDLESQPRRYGIEFEEIEQSTLHLEGALLQGSHLESADLAYAHLELAHLEDAHLEGANLFEARLDRANLSNAHLERAVLTDAHLEHANLLLTHFEHANLRGTNLQYANLYGANLEDADLSKTELEHTNLTDACLASASLRYASFDGYTNLTGARLGAAHWWERFVPWKSRGLQHWVTSDGVALAA